MPDTLKMKVRACSTTDRTTVQMRQEPGTTKHLQSEHNLVLEAQELIKQV